MKKRVNFNFISTLLIPIALLILAAGLYFMAFSASNDLSSVRKSINKTMQQQDIIEDVEGYALIARGTAYGLGLLATGFTLFLCILIVVVAGLLFIPSLIARLAYSPMGGRLLAYRIIMGVEYTFVILFGLLCYSFFRQKLWIAILSCGYCLIITIIGCMNTYTAKIKS